MNRLAQHFHNVRALLKIGEAAGKATFSGVAINEPTDVSGLVPKTTTVNGHSLTGDITLTAADVSADPAGTAVQLITALVGASPATLDQINELAAAIGNDPNFAVTLAASLAGKMSATDARVSETRTDLVAANGGVSTLNLSLGRSFKIDASALTSANTHSIEFSSVPAGTLDVAVTVYVVTGASIVPITWPTAGMYGLTASKTNRVLLDTLDNGASWSYVDGGVR